MLSFADRMELHQLRCDEAALAMQLALLKLRLCAWDEDKHPRVPSGSPGGGQWTSGGEGGRSASSDGGARPSITPPPSERGPDWRVLSTVKGPDGAVVEETVANGDGVVIRSEYPPAGKERFDERHTVLAPDGTIRSFETKDGVQTVYDNDWRRLSATAWTSDGPEQVETVEQAFLAPLAPKAAEATIVLGLSLYTFLSTRNGPDGQAVIAYPARQYRNIEGQEEPIFVGRLTASEVDDACKKYEKVQGFTDFAVTKINRNDYHDAATYGTAVHMFVRDKIDKLGRMDFRAEVSLLKTVDETDQLPREAEYGERGSIRIDALEHAKNNTACVYDIKTGKSGLLLGRAREIAATVKRNFPTAHWTIVTEVRPRR